MYGVQRCVLTDESWEYEAELFEYFKCPKNIIDYLEKHYKERFSNIELIRYMDFVHDALGVSIIMLPDDCTWGKAVGQRQEEITKLLPEEEAYCSVVTCISDAFEAMIEDGDIDAFKVILCDANYHLGLASGIELAKENVQSVVLGNGRSGGKKAAENRLIIRKEVKERIMKIIQRQFLWNDMTQTAKSITDRLWREIEVAVDAGDEWQGIPCKDFSRGKIGRATVYKAVTEADPR